jgi:D-alanyl-D-alanine dipeptidase
MSTATDAAPIPAGRARIHGPIRCEDLPGHADFRPLRSIPGIAVDLRYCGADNFLGLPLYHGMDCAWLRVEAADGVAQAAAWLARHHPERRLLLLDALRPQRVQERVWAATAGQAMQSYLANPVRGSIHSFGMAVDVTLIDAAGRESDMGSGFDEPVLRSHPRLEAEHLARGELTRAQVSERQILRAAMAQGGFRGIATEWWHFNHGDPEAVRLNLPRVE